MIHTPNLIEKDVDQCLELYRHRERLHFIVCARLNDDSRALIENALCSAKVLNNSQCSMDWLKSHYADVSEREEYANNIITHASKADVAIVMIDARKGMLTQTRRHSYLVSLIGIRHIVVAVHKMDLMGYSEKTYNVIVDEYSKYAKQVGIESVTFIPISEFKGDNITSQSEAMPWFHGKTLLSFLDSVEIDEQRLQKQPFRMPVQWVNRPNLDLRGFSGQISSGVVKLGAKLRVLPSGQESTITRIVSQNGDLEQAVAGQSVTISLAGEIDVFRGDILVESTAPAEVARQFETTIVWMHEESLMPGRTYLMKVGCKVISATVMDIKYQVNINTMEHLAAKSLELNGIGVCTVNLDQPIAFDKYLDNADTGSFILIDRLSNKTVGAGMINFALRRSQNIVMQHVDVHKEARSQQKTQKPCVIWLTGLSGAGKSTIANLVEKKLFAMGQHTYLLDGDNVRHGLNKDLGFKDEDRVENIRRVAEVAKLMVDAGLIVISAFISPFRAERNMAREMVEKGEFVEVFVNTSLEVAESRDVKGLYGKARRGELKNFTGIDSPYEAPQKAECVLGTDTLTAEECADQVIQYLVKQNYV